jgi:KDO2-lipid IV(A) lauroyltransferase
MAKLSHEIEYLATLLGVKLAQALPNRIADSFGAALGSLAHLMLASRRRITHDNLRRAMGETLTEEQRDQIVREVFRHTGRTLIEFARLGRLVKGGLDDLIVGDGLEHLQQVHDEGRGGIVVTAHFGSFELFGAWVGTRGYPMDFLTGVQHNHKVNDLLNGFRREIGVGLISIDRSLKPVFKALKANRLIGLISDQHAPSGVVVDFFGRPAATPKGPAAFAVKARAPILPFVMRRESGRRHVVMAGQPIYPPGSGDDDKDIQDVTAAYTRYFEECVRRYPDQWLWTHRRWKLD